MPATIITTPAAIVETILIAMENGDEQQGVQYHCKSHKT